MLVNELNEPNEPNEQNEVIMPKLSVSLGRLKLANPVIVASGAFGYGQEYKDLVSLKKIGAIATKTITLKARKGNPSPRIAETHLGMLNAIGLENPGLEVFLREKMPSLEKIGIPIIVSIAGDTPAEFAKVARRLSKVKSISALELNISCPNLNKKGLIAQDAQATYRVVKAVKRQTKLPIITKLSPNVTDIVEIAKQAKAAGSDILSLVNTFFGMALDLKTRRPKLGNITGGLSGPAIKPQSLYMVRRVYKAVKIPLIGMGGIMNAQDALEFIICGASAIAVGTANFVNPRATVEIIAGIKKYLEKNKIRSIKKLIGTLKR
ncbi:MAG: dihydroorotate dehydrogenase [Candidatus Omnitrophica bacterium]|nr:dihydroorotate dehydrogenase [Candidatus Omnitrophota bacterium]